ncbi:MAG TPA: DUF4160 domain-containing protein [Chloroflexota bacterium]|nr:DUF4160 domain-containing protein [Chloroflexota bacterium]
MPRISQFFGIIIAMYYNDHAPAHFHAVYAESEATIAIATLEVLSGNLPRRALALVLEWASLHREGLTGNWEKARQGEVLSSIEPLD